jgi:hypothetical protein
MAEKKPCRDCGEDRPIAEFTSDRRRPDGLSFYCKTHARRRLLASKDARQGPPRARHRREVAVGEGQKWCPDCGAVKLLAEFPTDRSNKLGVHTYCKPFHNARGEVSVAKVGGSRTYHLKRRYGITAEQADVMLAQQGGLCAVCRRAPAEHVDHDHATGQARQLLCFNCNGGLGQFRDDPRVLREAARYVERHGEPVPPRRVRRSHRPESVEVRRHAAGCPSHDGVRARVAVLIALLERPAAR